MKRAGLLIIAVAVALLLVISSIAVARTFTCNQNKCRGTNDRDTIFGTRVGNTIPHRVQGEAAAGVVMLRPASAGTGVIAGGPVRAVLECVGIHDILSKSLGSSNAINIVHATVDALKRLEEPAAVAARRGLPLDEIAPPALVRALLNQKAGV